MSTEQFYITFAGEAHYVRTMTPEPTSPRYEFQVASG